jgi:hypothetical protein
VKAWIVTKIIGDKKYSKGLKAYSEIVRYEPDNLPSDYTIEQGQFLTDQELEQEINKATNEYDLKFQAMEQTIHELQTKLFELEQLKEQVAREAFIEGFNLSAEGWNGEYGVKAGELEETFNKYYQQKNQGGNPILKRMNGDFVSVGESITKPIKFDKGEG